MCLVTEGDFSSSTAMLPALLNHLVIDDNPDFGVWWHAGSSQVSAQLLVRASMPGTEGFMRFMLDDDAEPVAIGGDLDVETNDQIDYLDELLSD